jgi:hypothetical protein
MAELSEKTANEAVEPIQTSGAKVVEKYGKPVTA